MWHGPALQIQLKGLTNMKIRTISQAVAFGFTAAVYAELRHAHPEVPALTIKRYLDNDPGLSLEQYHCETTLGHDWSRTGTDYGGDDVSFRGEGRVFCLRCGADGDA